MLDPLILRIISIGFASLFLLAAWHKSGNRVQFRGHLLAYQILPSAMIPLAVIAIPLIEFLLGMAWLVTALLAIRVDLVPLLSTLLLTAYTTAIAINLIRGRRHIDCGCGFSAVAGMGASDGNTQQLSTGLVIRNIAIIFTASLANAPVSSRELGLLDYFSLLTAGIALILIYAALNQLLANGSAIEAWTKTLGKSS